MGVLQNLYFNLIGTVCFMSVFYLINRFLDFPFLSDTASAAGIAAIHSLFNIGCAIVLFPFADRLVDLATFTVQNSKTSEPEQILPEELAALDERFWQCGQIIGPNLLSSGSQT